MAAARQFNLSAVSSVATSVGLAQRSTQFRFYDNRQENLGVRSTNLQREGQAFCPPSPLRSWCI